MFGDLMRAWREAVENFRRELHAGDDGRDPSVVTAIEGARRRLRRLEAELREARREVEFERREEQVCRRRERLALGIQDLETARIASEFASRHAERASVLERKVEALHAEHELLSRELAEMERSAAMRGASATAPGNQFGERRSPGLDPEADAAFDRLERAARERAAEARLEELKRRMR